MNGSHSRFLHVGNVKSVWELLDHDQKDQLDDLVQEKHQHSVCIINYKGGVGKTTITTLLGIYLAQNTKGNVLLMDIDPQCSLSLALGEDPENVNRTELTIYNLVEPKAWTKLEKKRLISYTKLLNRYDLPENLHLLPGSFQTDELDLKIISAFNEKEYTEKTLFLYAKKLLMGFAKDYDYILIDCPPNKMFLTQAMLRASSFYLPVTIPDQISIYGMPRLLNWVKKIPQNIRPKMLGYILNAVNRSGGGMVLSQQRASAKLKHDVLKHDVQPLMSTEERKVITDPCLGVIPRLDVIAKFLGGSIRDINELRQSASRQPSVEECLSEIVEKTIHRMRAYNEKNKKQS